MTGICKSYKEQLLYKKNTSAAFLVQLSLLQAFALHVCFSWPLNAHQAHPTIYRKSTRKSLQWQLKSATFTPFYSNPEKKKILFFTQLSLDLKWLSCSGGSSRGDARSAGAWGVHLPSLQTQLPALPPPSLGFILGRLRSLQLPAACPTPLLQEEHQSQLEKIGAVPTPQPNWKWWLPELIPPLEYVPILLRSVNF